MLVRQRPLSVHSNVETQPSTTTASTVPRLNVNVQSEVADFLNSQPQVPDLNQVIFRLFYYVISNLCYTEVLGSLSVFKARRKVLTMLLLNFQLSLKAMKI